MNLDGPYAGGVEGGTLRGGSSSAELLTPARAEQESAEARPLAEPDHRPGSETAKTSEGNESTVSEQALAHRKSSDLFVDLHAADDPSFRLPATEGWQGWINRVTSGFFKVGPSPSEVMRRRTIAGIQASLPRPMTILMANSAGGGGKTITSVGLAGTFGIHRGGGVVVLDNNETQGSLSIRTKSQNNARTVLDLLARVQLGKELNLGELSSFLRHQGNAHFEVLASSTRPEQMRQMGQTEFNSVHRVLSMFKQIVIVDSGNNSLAENFEAAATQADLLIVPTGLKRDQIQRALWTMRTLYEAGHESLVTNAVVVVTEDTRGKESGVAVKELRAALGDTAMDIIDIPYDPHLDRGTVIDVELLRDGTRRAYEQLAALVSHKLSNLPN